MPVARDGEVEHVGPHQTVIDDVGALRAGAVDEGRSDRRRREPHVARHRNPFGVQVGNETAADETRGVFVDFLRVEAANVVCLEDAGIDHKVRIRWC